MDKNTFYITTAISYPNGAPHIGHAYEAIATDAIARFMRLSGKDVLFVTGTDEHGLKMEQTARGLGMETRALADKNSALFKEMCAVFKISHDRFIRTTDDDHKLACQELWRRMKANGDIYLDRYEGWYSVRDEAYYDESELKAGQGGEKLSPQGTPVEWTVEESYFFRLSNYQQKLLDLYNAQKTFIQPESRLNEIVSFVKSGLRDLSISRTSFKWGVPVPDDERHVMYVWVDALTNYLTAAGYPDAGYKKYWPANTHIIGKDIVRFHAVYWPAFLMSAGIALPEQIFGHGFLLNRGEKMSKSTGNVVDPIELAKRYGTDAVRWYLLSKVSFGEDGSYSAEAIIETHNADLANSFGNLVQRVFSFIAKNLEGRIPTYGSLIIGDAAFLEAIGKMDEQKSKPIHSIHSPYLDDLRSWMNEYMISQVSSSWLNAVFLCNQYVDTHAPWALRKTDPVRMETVLAVLLDAIRRLAIAAQPFIPDAAAKALAMFDQHEPLNFDALQDATWYLRWIASGFIIAPPTAIFPRLELQESPPL